MTWSWLWTRRPTLVGQALPTDSPPGSRTRPHPSLTPTPPMPPATVCHQVKAHIFTSSSLPLLPPPFSCWYKLALPDSHWVFCVWQWRHFFDSVGNRMLYSLDWNAVLFISATLIFFVWHVLICIFYSLTGCYNSLFLYLHIQLLDCLYLKLKLEQRRTDVELLSCHKSGFASVLEHSCIR